MSIGIPLKLLHEAETHVVTIELKTGELFRGYLVSAEVSITCPAHANLINKYFFDKKENTTYT